MFGRILVAVDLDDIEHGRRALRQASGLIPGAGAMVRVLHVLPPVPMIYLQHLPRDFDAQELKTINRQLAQLAVQSGLPADTVSTAVRRGAAHVEILSEADALGADLIIIGAHQPTAYSKLLGTTAGAVVRHAQASVLVVRS
ncbi:universal stress protein [Rhodoligotrophos defluvii]|uniref:universal stress protein n=1 Tax=Rhodoligotrophos defluvii TaxID=2561934 RepID=UPI0010C9BED0|nr:universal stress protein [Rhodoligotrophos defluvii]